MTDSVSSIVAAQLGGDCSAWTYTLRSLDPFVTAPYEQFTEARSGEGVFTFLTGEGGFLQEFLYGYPGLRWREDRLRLDPMLPPQLADGFRVTGLRWRGRVLDLALAPGWHDRLHCAPARRCTLDTPAGPRALGPGSPLTLPTRTAGPAAGQPRPLPARPRRALTTPARRRTPPSTAAS